MTITAAICHYRPDSAWVHAFILTCDNRLAVWFNRAVRGRKHRGKQRSGPPGVCCYYPQSNPAMFQTAVSWSMPGNYVHRFLYKKMAYQLIRPPCPAVGCTITTTCCPAVALPTTLHLSFITYSSTPSLAIVYSSSSQAWSGACAVTGASPGVYKFVLQCAGSSAANFSCQVTGPVGDTNAAAVVFGQTHCSPFHLQFDDAIEGSGVFQVTL